VSRAATTRDRAKGGRDGRGSGRGDVPAGGAPPVTPLRPRRRRSRRAMDPRRRLLVVLAVVLVAAGALAWVLLGSSWLAVRSVQVDGESGLSEQQVVQVAGIAEGTPLLRVDTAAAAARVAALPQVDSVEVTRGWPNTVVVTLAERVPVAVVTVDGTRRLVDAEGVVFDTITGSAPAGVIPLDVRDPGPDDAATTAALGALTALPRAVRTEVTGVSARTADDVTLTLTDGRSVLWGSAADTDRKAQVLDALLAQIEDGALDPAQVLDVSTPDSVVLR
jgi:cell division septal protein FtsQ